MLQFGSKMHISEELGIPCVRMVHAGILGHIALTVPLLYARIVFINIYVIGYSTSCAAGLLAFNRKSLMHRVHAPSTNVFRSEIHALPMKTKLRYGMNFRCKCIVITLANTKVGNVNTLFSTAILFIATKEWKQHVSQGKTSLSGKILRITLISVVGMFVDGKFRSMSSLQDFSLLSRIERTFHRKGHLHLSFMECKVNTLKAQNRFLSLCVLLHNAL